MILFDRIGKVRREEGRERERGKRVIYAAAD